MKSRTDTYVCGLFSARERLLNELQDPHEKDSFVFETFLEFQKYGWTVAKSPAICRSLESFVPFCNVDSLVVLLKTLSADWDGVIKCRVCYHLLRKALYMCQTVPFSEDLLVKDFVELFLNYIKENMASYLKHPYGHHTLRLFLQLAAGVRLEKDSVTNTYVRECSTLCVPFDSNYVSTVGSLIECFLMTDDAYTYARCELLCPFLQILVLVASIRNVALLSENLDRIIEAVGAFSKLKPHQNLPDGFIHPVLVYLTELIVTIMPGKRFAKFMRAYVLRTSNDQGEQSTTSTLKTMVSHPVASRIARAVIKRIKKVTDLQAFLTTLAEVGAGEATPGDLCGAIDSGQHAVLNDLAIKCSNPEFSALQQQFSKLLYRSLGHSGKKPRRPDEDELIRSVVGLTSIDKLNCSDRDSVATVDLTQPVTLPGCLLAQTLLRYTTARPRILMASLCSQSDERLTSWAKHPMLSRVIESAVQSDGVSPSRIAQLLSALEPNLAQLACDRYGSRLVEAFWNVADRSPELGSIKKCIFDKLAGSLNTLHSHQFGRFVARKLSCFTNLSGRRKQKVLPQPQPKKRLLVGKVSDSRTTTTTEEGKNAFKRVRIKS